VISHATLNMGGTRDGLPVGPHRDAASFQSRQPRGSNMARLSVLTAVNAIGPLWVTTFRNLRERAKFETVSSSRSPLPERTSSSERSIKQWER
jgi:hypothetical protein